MMKKRSIQIIVILVFHLLLYPAASCQPWCPLQPDRSFNTEFKQKTNIFWQFEEKSNRWVEVTLPYDLLSCINGSCSKVGLIEKARERRSQLPAADDRILEEKADQLLPLRKRMSLTKMSEASIWVTGQSGSIYERFWNGVRWVIAPHELQALAGAAVSVFIVNQTILALSESGMLYQLQLSESSQPIWTDFLLQQEQYIDTGETEPSLTTRIKTGATSHNGERLWLTTTNGSLIEISDFQPLR